MKKQNQTALTTLTQDDIARVAGAGIGPIVTKVPRAQDMYGNTLSHEEWMDRKLDTTKNPHDFYNGGFDPDKPHIWG